MMVFYIKNVGKNTHTFDIFVEVIAVQI